MLFRVVPGVFFGGGLSVNGLGSVRDNSLKVWFVGYVTGWVFDAAHEAYVSYWCRDWAQRCRAVPWPF